MDTTAIKREFGSRYYQWALHYMGEQARTGYPALRSIKGGLPLRFLDIIESLGPEDRSSLAVALVKRGHLETVKTAGESLTAKEEELIRLYLSLASVPGRYERQINAQVMTGAYSLHLDRRRFATVLKKELGPILGDRPEKWGSGEWRYETRIGDYVVHTYVDVGGRYHQLTYEHSVSGPQDRMLKERIAVLSWLGIAGQTNWDLLTESDVAVAAASLALVCSQFMRAAPSLLAGL